MAWLDFLKRRKKNSAHRAAFAAAAIDRLTSSWITTAQAINDELRGDLDRLRARAREMARNNDYARKFLRMVARNIVGPSGVVFQARVEDAPGRPDTLANRAIEDAWYRWCRRGSCEIGGRMSFEELCRAIVMGVARDGEAIVQIVRGTAAANAEGLALALLDVARLDTTKNRERNRGENAIVMGVEVDEWTRPVAYWIRPKIGSGTSVRVPATDIIHVYLPETAEQFRGIPWMHAAMLAMHDLGEFNRSALLAARKSADTLGFIVSPEGSGEAIAHESIDGAEPIKISAPGTYDVLPEGYDIRTQEYAYPNGVYDAFVKAILRRIASGLDVAYNSLANDLESVNYSSIRAGALEEREQWIVLQNWFIESFVEPIWQEWFVRALTVGSIVLPNGSSLPATKAEKFRKHDWQPKRWQWVDPLKDIEAARLAIKSGIASPQMIAAQNGVDIEDVLNALRVFESMADGIGLIDYEISRAMPTNEKTNMQG